MRTPLSTILVAALLVSACASDPKPSVTGYWIPALTITADIDENEEDDGIWFDADLATGGGWAARVGFEGDDGAGLGIVYMTTSHEESSTDRRARMHSAFVELVIPTDLAQDPPFFFGAFAGGVGGTYGDFDEPFDDTGGASAMLRAEGGFRPVEHVSVLASVGGFLWGYPGETIGYGAFLMLGVSAVF